MTTGQQAWLAGVALTAMKTGALPSLDVLRQTQPALTFISMRPEPGAAPGKGDIVFMARFTGGRQPVVIRRPASQWKVQSLP